ncbi:MAG: hypothetical protein WDN23_04075 [Edaphobacter sp.]
MNQQWTANLAEDIRQKAHDAAKDYGRSQHQAEIITTKGAPFFQAFADSLKNNVTEVQRHLQGDVTSSDTLFQTVSHTELKLTRTRFPWFDAHITYQDPTIALDYAKGPGVGADPSLDRKTCNFIFRVTGPGALFLEESFNENPKRFDTPEDFARHITELLFRI